MSPSVKSMSVVRNSHYISRFALKNWAHPKTGKVTVFDFSSGTFLPESTKRTYVADEAFPPDVEAWLATTIETHLGDYVASVKALPPPSAGVALTLPEPTERQWKAIRLWTMTQALRTALARDPKDDQLVEIVRKGDAFIDQLVVGNDQIARASVVFAARERLYFPETGIVGLPLVEPAAFGFFVPLHPRLFVATIPRAVDHGGIEATLHKLGLASALSAGLPEGGDLVVIPPLQEGVDLKLVESHLRLARESARSLTSIVVAIQASRGIALGQEWRPPPLLAPEQIADDDPRSDAYP